LTFMLGAPSQGAILPSLAEQISRLERGSEEYVPLEAEVSLSPDNRRFVLQFGIRISDAQPIGGVISQGQAFGFGGHLAMFFPGEVISPSTFDDAYSQAYLSNTLGDVISDLGVLFPGLRDIRPVQVSGGRWITYASLPNGALPLESMGDGFRAALVILAYASISSVLLLDSPEVFQHPRGLEILAKGLAEATTRRSCQIILATQSLELLDLLIKECVDLHIGLKVYRLGLEDSHPVVYPPLSLDDVKMSRELIGVDLRR
jgi:hypothetical protein